MRFDFGTSLEIQTKLTHAGLDLVGIAAIFV